MSDLKTNKLSDWLVTIQKIDWWISAAIVAASLIMLYFVYLEVPWFKNLPPVFLGIIGSAGLFCFFLIIFQRIDTIIKSCKYRVLRNFNKLSDQQREFLINIFHSGNRHTERLERQDIPRWLEELAEWNYLEIVLQGGGSKGLHYRITITARGWKHLENINN